MNFKQSLWKQQDLIQNPKYQKQKFESFILTRTKSILVLVRVCDKRSTTFERYLLHLNKIDPAFGELKYEECLIGNCGFK